MHAFFFLMQLCSVGACSPAQQSYIDTVLSNCGDPPSIHCIYRATHGRIEQTPTGVTILRGR